MKSWKQKAGFGLKVAFSAVLLIVLLRRVEMTALKDDFRHIDLLWLFGAYLCMWATFCAQTWRWRVMLESEGIHIGFRSLLGCFMVGYFFGHFLPSIVGGDTVKGLYLSRYGIGKTRSVTTVLIGRVIGTAALLVILLVCVAFSRDLAYRFEISRKLVWMWVAIVLTGMLSLFLAVCSNRFGNWLSRRSGIVLSIGKTIRLYKSQWRVLSKAFLISIFHQLIMLLRFYCAARAVGIALTFPTIAVVASIVTGITMIPVTVNGIGLRENGFVYLLGLLHVSGDVALAYSLANYGLMIVMALAGWVIYVVSHGKNAALELEPMPVGHALDKTPERVA